MGRPSVWVVVLLSVSFGADSAFTRLRQGAIQNNADFYLRLDNFNNVQYSAPLAIGGQTLPVIYDTGSFEILVLSKKCPTCEARHAVYDQAKSTSFTANNPSLITEHLFGSGPVVSEKGFDTVRIGGPTSTLVLSHMPFWQILRHEIAVWDESAHFSGIVGLGHPTYIPEGFADPASAADALLLASMKVKSFAFCLQRSSPAAPGWLIFGPTVDNAPVGSFFRSVDVVGQTHWGVRMYDFHIPGIVKPDPCVPSCGAIIDSGTSLIAAPPAAMPAIKQLSAMVKRDCSNLHELPTLKFRVGDHNVELPPKAYVMKTHKKVVVRKKDIWSNIFQPTEVIQEHCVPAFMTISKNSAYGPVWILGMPFLRYYYTVFDRINKKVFISEASPTCQPQQTGSNYAGAASLFNSTGVQMVNGTGAASNLGTRFSYDDFEANEVDPDEMCVPAWAKAADNEKWIF